MVYLKIPSRRVDRVFTAKGTQNLLVEWQGAFPFLCLLKKTTHLPTKKKKKVLILLEGHFSVYDTVLHFCCLLGKYISEEYVTSPNAKCSLWRKEGYAYSLCKALHISLMSPCVVNNSSCCSFLFFSL